MVRYSMVLLCLLMLSPAFSQTVKLRKSFVDSLRNKVTYNGTFDVFRFTGKASNDGDAHGVVYSPLIGLPCVAELMDKKNHHAPSHALKSACEKNDSIMLKGAWRMWWEHAGKGDQVQGSKYSLATANEAHIFEIHPLLEVDTHKVYSSFIPKGFHQPAKAFAAYRKRESTIVKDRDHITISSKMVGYNYVHIFIVKPHPHNMEQLTDGLRIKTEVRDSSGKTISKEETIILISGTPALHKYWTMKRGEVMEVVAMPRLSFNAVWNYLGNVPDNTPVTVPLPFELLVVGVIE